MMLNLRISFAIIGIILSFTKINFTYGKELFLISDRPLSKYFYTADPNKLCEYKQLIIYGINSYLKVKKIPCPGQVRIVTGILYLSQVYHSSDIYISPLPHPKSFKDLGMNFAILYSNYLEFYVKKLKNYYFIKAYKIKNLYDLEKIMPEVLKNNKVIIFLPDEYLIDERASLIVDYWLRQYPSTFVVDLVGFNLKLPNKIFYSFNLEKYLEGVKKYVEQGNLEKGEIYFVEY